MLTYRQLKRKKEFHKIKEILSRLEYNDIIENNPDYTGAMYVQCVDFIRNEWEYTTGYIKRTYWSDIWYLFDLLNWVRIKKYTL